MIIAKLALGPSVAPRFYPGGQKRKNKPKGKKPKHAESPLMQPVRSFLSLGLSLQSAYTMPSKTLKDLLADPRTFEKFHACVHALHMTWSRSNPRKTLRHKILLMAYILACQPSMVFDSMGDAEHALLDEATEMLLRFEEVCDLVAIDRLTEKDLLEDEGRALDGFFNHLFIYDALYTAWFVQDKEKLIVRIKHALVALVMEKRRLSGAPSSEEMTIKTIDDTIMSMKGRLLLFAGLESLMEMEQVLSSDMAAAKTEEGLQPSEQ